MKSPTSRTTRSANSGRFVLTRSKGEKISAVEGLNLTERMGKILDQKAGSDERRSMIVELVRRK